VTVILDGRAQRRVWEVAHRKLTKKRKSAKKKVPRLVKTMSPDNGALLGVDEAAVAGKVKPNEEVTDKRVHESEGKPVEESDKNIADKAPRSYRARVIAVAIAFIFVLFLTLFLWWRANVELPPGKYENGTINVDIAQYLNTNCETGQPKSATTGISGWPPDSGGVLSEVGHETVYTCSHDGPSLDAIILLLLLDVFLGTLVGTVISCGFRQFASRFATSGERHNSSRRGKQKLSSAKVKIIGVLGIGLLIAGGLLLWCYSSWKIRYVWQPDLDKVSASLGFGSNFGKLVGPVLMASGLSSGLSAVFSAAWDAVRPKTPALRARKKSLKT